MLKKYILDTRGKSIYLPLLAKILKLESEDNMKNHKIDLIFVVHKFKTFSASQTLAFDGLHFR